MSAPDPQPWPLNARFADDFVTQLVLVMSTDTMDEVAEKVAYHVVGRRLPDRGLPKVVVRDGKVVPSGTTIADSGIPPLRQLGREFEMREPEEFGRARSSPSRRSTPRRRAQTHRCGPA